MKQKTLKNKLETLIKPYEELHLECDGFTRVVTYLLKKENIKHEVWTCELSPQIPFHVWVRVGNLNVDYRLRMWLGQDAPHGVFGDDQKIYKNKNITAYKNWDTSDLIFKILTL